MSRSKYEADDEHFSAPAYKVKGYSGIAWYVLGWETQLGPREWYDEEAEEWVEDEDPEDVRTGMVVAMMVGDDRHFVFDEDEIEAISRESYCGGCGQIGCGCDGLDRSEAVA